jgi:hypothetical protein
MASKSTGSAAVAAAAVPGGSGGVGVEQKIADNIFQPWQIQHLHVNSEMKDKWCCCCSEMGAETQDIAVMSGFWSVHN